MYKALSTTEKQQEPSQAVKYRKQQLFMTWSACQLGVMVLFMTWLPLSQGSQVLIEDILLIHAFYNFRMALQC